MTAAPPADLLDWLRAAGLDPSGLVHHPKPGPPRPVLHYRIAGTVVDVATSAAGRNLLALEVRGRRWAQGLGVGTAQLLGQGPDWLVSTVVETSPGQGSAYLAAAAEAADRIAAAASPAAVLTASTWRGNRLTLPLRLLRQLAGGLPLPLWHRARAAAARLALHGPAHGDFYPRNALWTGDRLAVVDWEFLGPAPYGTDLLRLWSTLHRPQDRAEILELLLSRTPASARAELGTLALYLGLRLLGENLAAADRLRDQRDLAHARVVAVEARGVARRLGSPAG